VLSCIDPALAVLACFDTLTVIEAWCEAMRHFSCAGVTQRHVTKQDTGAV
jgi:hypothetical protein